MDLQPRMILFVPLILHGLMIIEGVNFNREFTGVEFAQYSSFDAIKYAVDNIRTMLEVVSGRFSRVLISSIGHQNAKHIKNHTYHQQTNFETKFAEMAAYMNRDRRNLSLKVTIGIRHRSYSENTGMELAVEATEIANLIFPGTVEGLYLSGGSILKDGLLTNVVTLRKMTSHLGIRIGVEPREDCERIYGQSYLDADTTYNWTQKKYILENVDFINCKLPLDLYMFERVGVNTAFNRTESRIVALKNSIKSMDQHVQVVWYAGWLQQSGERVRYNVTKHIRDLRDFWLQANSIATKHMCPVWLRYAIGSEGWWRLRRPDLINKFEGYVEHTSILPNEFEKNATKSEPHKSENTTQSPTPTTEDAVSTSRKADTDMETSVSNKVEKVATTSESGHTLWKYIQIIIGIVSMATVLSIFAYFINRRRSSTQTQILTRQEIDEFRHGIANNEYIENTGENFVNTTALKQPYNESLEIRKDKLQILQNQLLGGGEFGCVFKALLRDETDNEMEVALKTTKPNAGATAVKGLLSEIKILSYLRQHPNIVPILGAYTAEIHKGTVYITTELCPLGSLRTCLKKCREATNTSDISSIPLTDMIRWSHEIACGMEYLETKSVIHADLATRNVLLSSESTAKITDFGLSRRMYEYTNYTKTTQEPLPWRWMAYESLKLMEFSSRSDVWSYGVTLWEIFSLGAQPYPGIGWTLDFIESLECGFRLKTPEFASPEMFEIIEKCWILDRNARPSFTELKLSTRQLLTGAIESQYTTVSADHDSKTGTTA